MKKKSDDILEIVAPDSSMFGVEAGSTLKAAVR